MFQNRMNHPLNWIMVLWCAGVLLNMRTLPAEIGLTSQPEPLGYPGSLDDPADALAEKKSGLLYQILDDSDFYIDIVWLFVIFIFVRVEGGCAIKHTSHIRHIGHVPIIERLVEGGCV